MKIVHQSTMYISLDDYTKLQEEYKEFEKDLDREPSNDGFYQYVAAKYGMFYNRFMRIRTEQFNFSPNAECVDKILKENSSDEMIPLKIAYNDGYKDGKIDGKNSNSEYYNDEYPSNDGKIRNF